MARHSQFLWRTPDINASTRKRSLAEALKSNFLFSTLSERELRALGNVVYERIYHPGESIFEQDDRGFGMYFIVQGRVSIRYDAAEGPVEIAQLGPNEFFGELSLVDPEHTRTASAVAIEKCILVGFFRPDLQEILERKPAMGVKVLLQLSTVLGRRLLETTEKITTLAKKAS